MLIVIPSIILIAITIGIALLVNAEKKGSFKEPKKVVREENLFTKEKAPHHG